MIDAAALATLRHAAAHVLVPDVDDPDVDDATAHHIFRVLRLRDGETVTVTDGRGRWRPCRVVAQALEPTGPSHATGARGRLFTVAFAIPKGERPEWIVQKLTELGIDRIVVLHTERSVVRWEADRAHRHIDKLQRVAIEALQQSRGLWLPEIVGPVPATDVVTVVPVAEPGGRPLAAGDDGVAVGPEGGWSDGELEMAVARIDLGPSVLRVETAAVAGAARLVTGRG